MNASREGGRIKISRYRVPQGPQAANQPGSHGRVLLKRLGLTTKRAVDRAEAQALARVQEVYYAQLTPQTRITATLLKQMYRNWLGEIYEWAGNYRTVELEKDGFRWPPAERVADNLRDLERGVLRRYTPCKPGSLEKVALAIAVVHAELLLIHPFRDGNARVARWLADVMAVQANYPASAYGFLGREAKDGEPNTWLPSNGDICKTMRRSHGSLRKRFYADAIQNADSFAA